MAARISFSSERMSTITVLGGWMSTGLFLSRRVKARGFSQIQAASNGLRFARSFEFAQAASEAGLDQVYLQFDGLNDNIYLKTRGRRMLALELKQKGISSEVAAEALAEQLPESGERELLINLIRKRLRTSSRSDPERFQRRLLGFLARRGFSYGEIRSVLAEHFPEI